jgi:shikimate dehydrogenase
VVGETRPGRGEMPSDLTRLIDRATDADTRPLLRAGLLGRGIHESLSPRMHEAEGARLGLRYQYRLFDFDELGLADSDLPILIRKLRLGGYAGCNITHPFKERVAPVLDRLSEDAVSVGAVNTIVFEGGKTIGHNTDCFGFAECFRRGLKNPRLDRVVLIGAGGAGRAVARALIDLGAHHLAIIDTEREKASQLAANLNAATSATSAVVVTDLEAALRCTDGLVNATPVGMAKYPGIPIDPRWLRSDLWVADIVYFPAETELLRAAGTAGCDTLPGEGMAIFQAVRAFQLITGAIPDPGEMARHFRSPAPPPR